MNKKQNDFSNMQRKEGQNDEQFWRKVKIGWPWECWPWLRGKSRGYGKVYEIGRGRRPELAHRWAYVSSGGKLLPGQIVRHTCDNPSCCNPAHLRAGTQKQNMRDRYKRTGSRNGITFAIAEKIRAEYRKALRTRSKYGLQTELARKYGTSREAMNKLLNGIAFRNATEGLFGGKSNND